MADKTLKLKIDSSDVVALKDKLENVEIKTINVISAQEILQGILTSPEPVKNMDKIIPAYQKMGTIVEGMSKLLPRSAKGLQEVQASIQTGINKELDGAKKISDAHKKKLDEIKKEEAAFIKSAKEKEKEDLSVLNFALANAKKRGDDTTVQETLIRKLYEQTEAGITRHIQDNNDKRALIIQDSMKNMATAIDDNYEKQKASLEAKYKLETQAIKNATDLTIASEDEKTAHIQYSDADRQAMAIARFQKLKDLDAQYNEESAKLEQQYQKDKAGTFENFLKQRGEKMEVHVDTASKKIKKSTEKVADELDFFFQDMMLKDKTFSDKTVSQIVDHSVKSQKAITDAAEKAAEANNQSADATKKNAEATDKAADATKKYLDIQATRTNYANQINEDKALRASMMQNMMTQVDVFNEEIAAAGDNAEKRKEIETKKLEYIKQAGAELITIQQSITAAEKKEQDLGMVQWKQYTEQLSTVANSIKGALTQTADYFGATFGAISSVYKAEIDAIDEDIKQNKVNIAAIKYDAEQSTSKLKELEEEKKKATEQGQTQKAQQLQNEIDYHNGILATKKEYDDKDKALEDKKAKKQKEQEKIEKLNRKATLLKNIGEGIFNVAQGVTKALSYGPILGPILAAVVAAAGAIQVGIMTKQLAKFADGGLLNGKRHSQGGMRIEGTNIEVEGGEYVINRESTSKNLGLVRYINSQRKELTPSDVTGFFARASQGFELPFQREFASGGLMPAIEAPESIDNDALIKAIKSIKIESKVAVTDIIRAQEDAVQVDRWSGN
ncbi:MULTISPECIES: hypothetical protein [unclassified Dysgonomonas]|uniref:hypothetical protein n=1 Tax=unclassified Dysgonomonas TaxID=2630389 RepID=UPI0025BA74CC|nr:MULTISPECIES: hypothetical protein [unclassified Dysgonomonas]HMM01933.1 hypothetical protein [Dysgonomonas sp.]